jgi:toxin ParE1/3/4
MQYTVYFINDAEKDLFEIHEYVKDSGYPLTAMQLFRRIEKACSNLADFPERGRVPPELERIGVLEYREIIIGVYRIIYRIINQNVFIYCVLDGRRDIQEILHHRILR